MPAKKTPVPETTSRTNVRSRKPKTHAAGKPVRGVRPGVRGPNKKPDEILAEKMGMDKVLVIPAVTARAPQAVRNTSNIGGYHPPSNPDNRNQKINRQLQDLIREIGNEVVDPNTGWTRIIAVVRRLYYDASMGKTAATALLLERGWGKVPAPLQINMREEVRELMSQTGLTAEEINTDPILKEIMANAIDAQWHDAGNVSGAERNPPGTEQSPLPPVAGS